VVGGQEADGADAGSNRNKPSEHVTRSCDPTASSARLCVYFFFWGWPARMPTLRCRGMFKVRSVQWDYGVVLIQVVQVRRGSQRVWGSVIKGNDI
jgi:hypothetical protein